MKKIVALICSIIMTITVLPSVAFADGGQPAPQLIASHSYSISGTSKDRFEFTTTSEGQYSVSSQGGADFEVYPADDAPDNEFIGGTPCQTMGRGGNYNGDYYLAANTNYVVVLFLHDTTTTGSGTVSVSLKGGGLNPVTELEFNQVEKLNIDFYTGTEFDFETGKTIKQPLCLINGDKYTERMGVIVVDKNDRPYDSQFVKIKGYKTVVEVSCRKVDVTTSFDEKNSSFTVEISEDCPINKAQLDFKAYLVNESTDERILMGENTIDIKISPQEYLEKFDFLQTSKADALLYQYNDQVNTEINLKVPGKISYCNCAYISENGEELNQYLELPDIKMGNQLANIKTSFNGRTNGKFSLGIMTITMEDGYKICMINEKANQEHVKMLLNRIEPVYRQVTRDLSSIQFTIEGGIDDKQAPIITDFSRVTQGNLYPTYYQSIKYSINDESKISESFVEYVKDDIQMGGNFSHMSYKGKDGYWHCDIPCNEEGNYKIMSIHAKDIYDNEAVLKNSSISSNPHEVPAPGTTSEDLSALDFTVSPFDTKIVNNNVVSYFAASNKNANPGDQVNFRFHVKAPEGKEVDYVMVGYYTGNNQSGYTSTSAMVNESFNGEIITWAYQGNNGIAFILINYTDETKTEFLDTNFSTRLPGTELPNYEGADVKNVDFSNSFFTVESTGDVTGPTLHPDTLKILGQINKVGDEAAFTMQAEDESGIRNILFNMSNTSNNPTYVSGRWDENNNKIIGTIKSYCVGKNELVSIEAEDNVGKKTTLYNSMYSNYDGKTPAADLSAFTTEIARYERDDEAPVLDTTSFIPPQKVAKDSFSQVYYKINEDNPINTYESTLCYRRLTRNGESQDWYYSIFDNGDGYYSSSFAGASYGKYTALFFRLKDANGNEKYYVDNKFEEEFSEKYGDGVPTEKIEYVDLNTIDYEVVMRDEKTNISIAGNIDDSAIMNVSPIVDTETNYSTLLGENNAIDVKGCYEVGIINGEYTIDENLAISFQPEGVVPGDTVTIKHLRSSDSQLEQIETQVNEDGMVSMPITSFSPFMVLVNSKKMHEHTFKDGICTQCLESAVASKGELKPGDVNGDKKVNALDIIRTMKSFIEEETKDDQIFVTRDFNDDGRINCADLVRLLRFLSKELIEIF